MAQHLRPTWDEYFLSVAMLISTRSPDEQTQHGCVIVNEDKHIVGTGYNGFPSGIDDSDLPRIRTPKSGEISKGKYPYIIHSEANSIYSMELRQENLTAYITGKPCIECLKTMYANGVVSIVYINRRGSIIEDDPEYIKIWQTLVDKMNMKIKIVPIDTIWLKLAAQKFDLATKVI